jgi:bisphosphoglycerate-independent phosphoglycerate mutase (AlkP superfamily)
MHLNKVTDVRRGNALTAEITNERWNTKLGYKLPVIKPETAAKRLLRIASKNKFTLYEYFLTDHIGHGRYDGETESTIKDLDIFLLTILKKADYERFSIIICSDHGNFEDLSVKTHTFNQTLTITAGQNAEKIYKKIKNISHIKDAIIKYSK